MPDDSVDVCDSLDGEDSFTGSKGSRGRDVEQKQTDVDIRSAPWEPIDNNRSDVHLVKPQISFQ